MKWTSFKEKKPYLGTNILITNDDGDRISIIEWDNKAFNAYIRNEDDGINYDYFGIDWFGSDPDDDGEYDISMATYWTYISHLIKQTKGKK